MTPRWMRGGASAASLSMRVARFFWFCAGADLELIGRCATDHPKYTSIGLTVFLTAILASISASYLIYSGTSSPVLAAFFAPVWGLVILNLNRFVVLSMRLEQSAYRNFLIAFPRLLIALILSIVIMTPLQLKLFSPEINERICRDTALDVTTRALERQRRLDTDLSFLDRELNELNRQAIAEMDALAGKTSGADPETSDLVAKIERLAGEQSTLSAALKKTDEDEANASRELADEAAGRDGRPAGQGPVWRGIAARVRQIQDDQLKNLQSLTQNKERLARLEGEKDAILDRVRKEIERINQRISELRGQRQSAATSHGVGDYRKPMGNPVPAACDPTVLVAPFLSQYHALHAIIKEDRAAEWIVFVLQVLMFLIETSPLVAKILSPMGAYEGCFTLKEKRIVAAFKHDLDDDQY